MQELAKTIMDIWPIVIGVNVILVYGIYFIVKMIKKKKEINEEEVDNEWEIYKNPSSDITTKQYKKLAVAAIYSQQQNAYINSLTTGLDKERILTLTGQWWKINNSREAIDTLDYLQNKGFAYYFSCVYKAFQTDNEEEKKNIIINAMVPEKEELSEEKEEIVAEDINKAYSQQYHLTEIVNDLKKWGVIIDETEIKKYGVVCWDCGRLNFVARMCYDAGYITEEQAWYYIDQAYQLAKRTFRSWEDLATSYVIGRSLWSGKDEAMEWIAYCATRLNRDPESPFTQIEW